ncbi:MAG: AraC family transcriptional regulator [Acidobacteriaceae bacterium]|nr:AraC family transcriptional regulator [Acidobacteriaceae bacterium]
MHLSRSGKPSNAAGQFVQQYLQREAQLGSTVLIHPVPARAAHMISFQFGGPVGVRFYGMDVTRTAESAAFIGPQTHQRCQLVIRGDVETFVIAFRPSAIHRLFGLPAAETINRDDAAHAVLGVGISALREELGNARNFQKRVQIADRFIIAQSSRAHAACSIELAANEIALNHGACRIESLVQHTGLSMRSFQRMFQQRIGVSPKLYSRIVRFESALKTKAASPHLSWMTVAHQFGYHDQMHMIHDFKQLSGEAPTSLLVSAEAVLGPQIDSTPQPDTDLLQL